MQKNIDICFVSGGVYNYLKPGKREGGGGAERQQYMIGKELRDRGYDVSYIIRRYDEPYYEEIDGFSVYKGIPRSTGLTVIPRRFFELYRTIQRCDADIYYFRGNPLQAIIGSYCCRLTNNPYIYAVANDFDVDPDLNDKNRLFQNLFLKSVDQAAAVTTLTAYQQTILNDRYDIGATVIPCGYTLPPEEEVIPHEERDYVLWVGRLNRSQKRPERFLELAAELPDIDFVMIAAPSGDQDWDSRIKQRAESIENLEFKGYVPPDEIDTYFQRAAILVNTSDYEGFGNVFLEAFRYGTPVVSIKYSIDNLINQENVGMVSGNMKNLIHNTEKLYHSTECRNQSGEKGRDLIRGEFNISTVVDKLSRIFQSI